MAANLLEHGRQVPHDQSHQEGQPQAAGHQVEEGWLGRLEDVHDQHGDGQAKDVGHKASVEIELRFAFGTAGGEGEGGGRGGRRKGGKKREERWGGGREGGRKE